MNLKILVLLGALNNGFVFANNYEDDFRELMRSSTQSEPQQRTQNNTNNRNIQPLPAQQPLLKKPLKKLDYEELYINFECYEHLKSLEEFDVNKDALVERASEEIELFETIENENYNELVRYSAATIACFLLLCVPLAPVPGLDKISDDLKIIVSGLGGVGCVVLAGGTGAKAYEYIHSEQSSKARHSAIKKWLLKVH